MNATEKAINDLRVAKNILCYPQMLTPEMCVRIGQAITSAIALLKEQEAVPVDTKMTDKNTVMGWLEGLTQDDWRQWHSDSEVQQTAKAALVLLKEQEWNLLKEDTDGIIRGLPGDDGQYLMTDGKDIWIDIYVDGVSDGIILDSGRDVREIKAWMELPDLPKGDER